MRAALTRAFAPAECRFGALEFPGGMDVCTRTKWRRLKPRCSFLARAAKTPLGPPCTTWLDSVAIWVAPVSGIDTDTCRRERPRGRARGPVRAPRAGSLTPLPHCDTGNRALTGRHKAPPDSRGGYRFKALLYTQLEAVYRRSATGVKGGSAVTPARREGANRAFGQRSPFSAPSGRRSYPPTDRESTRRDSRTEPSGPCRIYRTRQSRSSPPRGSRVGSPNPTVNLSDTRDAAGDRIGRGREGRVEVDLPHGSCVPEYYSRVVRQ